MAAATANLHHRVVELSGSPTLSVIAGMLHEISAHHVDWVLQFQKVSKTQYARVFKSYGRLVDLVTARDGNSTEIHWRRHLENSAHALLKGHEKTKVRDMLL